MEGYSLILMKRAFKRLTITPAKCGSGYSDVSEKHDLYLTGVLPKKRNPRKATIAPVRSR
jgi:hypothetical protein